ncbi:SDR family oxidoreductase, partial [Salmonella enterica]|uniref:SDR family oxidoreductase n=1 Tax=Salmonella enterica TaxID=28901 RepID=UPI003FA79328
AEADYDFMFDTNVKGAFFVAQEVGRRMVARAKGAAPGTYTGGRIVNIASVAGLRVLPQIGVYCMSKAAVVHMTRAMATEWGRYGINVNAIAPGFFPSKMTKGLLEKLGAEKMAEHAPLHRLGDDDDLKGIA